VAMDVRIKQQQVAREAAEADKVRAETQKITTETRQIAEQAEPGVDDDKRDLEMELMREKIRKAAADADLAEKKKDISAEFSKTGESVVIS
jgi:hypothetical protein